MLFESFCLVLILWNPFKTFIGSATPTLFLPGFAPGRLATTARNDRKSPLVLSIVPLILLLFLLIGDGCDDHFSRERAERRRHIYIGFRTDSVRVKEAILLSEFSYTFLCLEVVQLWFVHFVDSINLVHAEHNWNWLSIDRYYFIDFLFPLRCVFNRLQISNVCDHNHPLGLSAEISIEALIARVHPDQVPHFQSHLVPLHLQQFKLVVWPNCGFVFCEEAIADEAIDDASLANCNVAKHYNLERKTHLDSYNIRIIIIIKLANNI